MHFETSHGENPVARFIESAVKVHYLVCVTTALKLPHNKSDHQSIKINIVYSD